MHSNTKKIKIENIFLGIQVKIVFFENTQKENFYNLKHKKIVFLKHAS